MVDIDVDEEGSECEVSLKENESLQVQESAKKVQVNVASPMKESIQTMAKSNPIPREQQHTLATPAVRRIAKETTVNLSLVQGTGPNGRILKGDVLDFIQGIPSQTEVVKVSSKPAQSTANVEQQESPNVPLTTLQKAMFKSMTKSLAIPHFGYSDEINLNSCSQLRKSINEYLSKSKSNGLDKISFMPIFIKALSLSLNVYPILNATLVNEENVSTASLLYRKQHNIGVAMDTPQGYFFL